MAAGFILPTAGFGPNKAKNYLPYFTLGELKHLPASLTLERIISSGARASVSLGISGKHYSVIPLSLSSIMTESSVFRILAFYHPSSLMRFNLIICPEYICNESFLSLQSMKWPSVWTYASIHSQNTAAEGCKIMEAEKQSPTLPTLPQYLLK